MYSCFCSLEIHPSILAQVHVVDLSLSPDEIHEQMLTQLLQSECKELLIQHLRFQNEKHLLQEKLFKEKVTKLLYYLPLHQVNTVFSKCSLQFAC